MSPSKRVQNVLVLLECDSGGELLKSSLCAVTFAKDLCGAQNSEFFLCLMSSSSAEARATACHLGARQVLLLEQEPDEALLAENLAPNLRQLSQERGIRLLLSAATSFGKDILPRVSALLDCAYIGDCCGIAVEGENLEFLRPIYAGNATASCIVHTDNAVLTVRHSEFAPAVSNCPTPSEVEIIHGTERTIASNRVKWLGFDSIDSKRPTLTDARVIVSGGRALSSQFLTVLGPLADCLDAAIGATRAACDSGYAPSDFQVGQTGKVVAPDLYIAIGISGAVQHVAGMRSSRVVVAINSDPDAPIFSFADYYLVGDLFKLVPELVGALRAHGPAGTH